MQSSKEYIRTVALIYTAMLLGQILLLIVSIWVIVPRRERQHDFYYKVAIVGIFIIGIILGYRLYMKYVKKGRRRRGIREKLIQYKNGLYCQWAVIEFMTLSAIAAYIMTAERVFIFATVFSIIAFLVSRPTINRTIEDLEMDDNESRVMRTPDAAI